MQQTKTQVDIPALLPSWQRFLRAARRSPRTVQSYTEAAEQLADFLVRHGMPTAVESIRRGFSLTPSPRREPTMRAGDGLAVLTPTVMRTGPRTAAAPRLSPRVMRVEWRVAPVPLRREAGARRSKLGPGSYSILPRPSSTSGSASGMKNGHSHSWNRHGPAYAWMNSACRHWEHGLGLLGGFRSRTADRMGFVMGPPNRSCALMRHRPYGAATFPVKGPIFPQSFGPIPKAGHMGCRVGTSGTREDDPLPL